LGFVWDGDGAYSGVFGVVFVAFDVGSGKEFGSGISVLALVVLWHDKWKFSFPVSCLLDAEREVGPAVLCSFSVPRCWLKAYERCIN
jgi:hypothetical protein